MGHADSPRNSLTCPCPLPTDYPYDARMASIQRHGRGWRVQVYVAGRRTSKVCRTRQEAAQWALEREAELSGAKLPDKTFGDALEAYRRDVAPSHRGWRWERIRLLSLEKEPIARLPLAGLEPADFTRWRDRRLTQVSPGTVAREMTLLRSVLEYVRRDHRWIRDNPMRDVRRPQTPPARRRRVSPCEVAQIVEAFGVEPLAATTATQRTGLAFLFALETAMRSGEIVGLMPDHVFLRSRYVVLPRTKNGDKREVPLTQRTVEILEALPKGEGPVFGLDADLRDALWRKHRPAGLRDLRFHDSRAEAIWRLSKKLDVLQLARVIGHRNPASLMFYYDESAADMAMQLD